MRVNVILGRFNPFSIGHYKIITKTNNIMTLIFVIDGEHTSKNIERNPLSLNERLNYIKNLNIPNTKLYYASNAYEVNDICEVLNYSIENVICGIDREKAYKKLFNSSNIICFDRNDNISSTNIRNSIKNNDYDLFLSMVPESNNNKKIYDIIHTRLLNGNTTNANNRL